MCKVNDNKREILKSKIKENEKQIQEQEENLEEVEKSKEELEELIEGTDCVLTNMEKCNFGGDIIVESITENNETYKELMEYYEELIEDINNQITKLKEELEKLNQELNSLPEDCGYCSECRSKNSNSGAGEFIRSDIRIYRV